MPEVVNPYIAGSPVTSPEMFFGRDDVFAFIRQALTGKHQDNIIVLYGQRRTGKTSVLYQMHRYLDPRYLPVFIDLHGMALEGLGGLLWELANLIQRSLRRDYKIELPRLNRAEFMGDPRAAFENDFLGQVWSALGDRHLLLMLDEAIRLQEQVQAGKLERQVFEYLRHLMQHDARLNFLFSLGSGLEEMEKEYAFLFSVALYKKISFLDRASAVALITQPAQEYYTVEPGAVERILELTSGHAYYTQLLCHSLFARWQRENKAPITVSDVDASLDEVVERGLAVLKHVWEESSPAERAVLAGIAAAQGDSNRPVSAQDAINAWKQVQVNIPPGDVAKALKALIARDVLAGEDRYRFAVDLQRRYVSKYERLEWVKEEIPEAIRAWETSPAPPSIPPPLPEGEGSPPSPAPSSPVTSQDAGRSMRARPATPSLVPQGEGKRAGRSRWAPLGIGVGILVVLLALGTFLLRDFLTTPTSVTLTRGGTPVIIDAVPVTPNLSRIRTPAPSTSSGGATPTPVAASTGAAGGVPDSQTGIAQTTIAQVTRIGATTVAELTTSAQNAPATPGGNATPLANPPGKPTVLTNSDAVYQLAVLGDQIWAATSGGLARYAADGTRQLFTSADGLPFNSTRVVFAAPDGTLWAAGRAQGLVHLKPDANGLGEITIYRSDQDYDISYIRTFMIDRDGSLWAAGSYGKVVSRFDGTRWSTPNIPTDDPLLKDVSPSVLSMLRDRDGNLWLGMEPGILRWNGSQWKGWFLEHGQDSRNGRKLIQTRDGTLFAALDAGGLVRFDPATDQWQSLPTPGDAAFDIEQLPDGSLWLLEGNLVLKSTDNGAHWEPIGERADNIPYGLSALLQDRTGVLWLGTDSGLLQYSNGQWRTLLRPSEITDTSIQRVLFAPDGRLVGIPLYGGRAFALDLNSYQSEGLGNADSKVTDIAFQGDQTFAATSDGMYIISPGGTRRISTDDGLPSNQVRRLLATPDRVMIGTVNGLALYDLKVGKVTVVPDLAGNVVSALLHAPDGSYWVGTTDEDGTTSTTLIGRYDGSTWQVWRPGNALPLDSTARGVEALIADQENNIWVGLYDGGIRHWDGKQWTRFTQEDGAPGSSVYALAARSGEVWVGGATSGRLYRWTTSGWSVTRVPHLTGNVLAMQFAPGGALWLGTDDGLVRYVP